MGPAADSRCLTVESQFQDISAFSASKAVTHILPCCAPTSAPTLSTGLDIYPTEFGLVRESDQQLQLLTPWPCLLTAVPHPAVPSGYKRKLPSQSTEKQEMTVRREVLAWSSVLPRDSRGTDRENRAVSTDLPPASATRLLSWPLSGESFLLFPPGDLQEEKRNMCSWHSSLHDKNNFMTDFVDGDSTLYFQ